MLSFNIGCFTVQYVAQRSHADGRHPGSSSSVGEGKWLSFKGNLGEIFRFIKHYENRLCWAILLVKILQVILNQIFVLVDILHIHWAANEPRIRNRIIMASHGSSYILKARFTGLCVEWIQSETPRLKAGTVPFSKQASNELVRYKQWFYSISNEQRLRGNQKLQAKIESGQSLNAPPRGEPEGMEIENRLYQNWTFNDQFSRDWAGMVVATLLCRT